MAVMQKCSLVFSVIAVTVVSLEMNMWNICINSDCNLCAVQGWPKSPGPSSNEMYVHLRF
jgi:hypothetical protein